MEFQGVFPEENDYQTKRGLEGKKKVIARAKRGGEEIKGILGERKGDSHA